MLLKHKCVLNYINQHIKQKQFPKMQMLLQQIQTTRMIQKQKKSKLFRNIRSQITKNIYQCECGKRYESFPALCLHFKRKHTLKISADRSKSQCEIQETGLYRTLKFYYNNHRCQPYKKVQKQNEIQDIIKNFVKNQENAYEFSQDFMKCMQSLALDFKDRFSNAQEPNIKQTLEEHGQYFNQFMKKKEGELCDELFQRWSQVLIHFSEWLLKNDFSKNRIEWNEDYIKPKFNQN